MEVKLNDTYSVESDERNYVLKRTVLREARDGVGSTGTGYNEYHDYTYYWHLQDLRKAVIEKVLKTDQSTKTVEAVDAFNMLCDVVESCHQEFLELLNDKGFENLVKHTKALRAGAVSEVAREDVPIKAKRGRKPGSKNKVKK